MNTNEYMKAIAKAQREYISKIKDGMPKDEYLKELQDFRDKIDEIERQRNTKRN